MKPICILLYEDNAGYCDSFKLQAQSKRIIVDAVNNVDDLIESLESNRRKHKFVVLDGRAYLHEGQTGNTQTEANLHKIIREISKLEKKQDRVIPYCVNTGFAEIKINHAEVLECEIFEKGNEENLFEFIWKCYNNSDAAKLRADFPEVFDFADAYFDDASIELLSKLLGKNQFHSSNIADRVDNLSRLRRLIEHLLDIVFIRYLNEQPGVIRNRSTRASDIINYLNQQDNVPPQVFGSVVNILKTASNFGSHTPEQASTIHDYPTANTIISLTFGFFETVSWCKKLLTNSCSTPNCATT